MFKYTDELNSLAITKEDIETKEEEIFNVKPLVEDGILLSHNMFDAPSKVYELFL